MSNELLLSPLISSLHHPELRHIASLKQREPRDRTGRFYVEGLRFVARAAESDRLVTVLVSRRSAASFALELARRSQRRGVRVLHVSDEVLARLGHGADHQGIGAVARQEWTRLPESSGALWLAISELRSVGNLGTIIRTAEAAGVEGIALLGPSIDPHDPRAVRAAMGSTFDVRFARTSLASLSEWCLETGRVLFGAAPGGNACYRQVAASLAAPAVLLLGEERRGLGTEELAACDELVRIPMVGRTDSLNVAVAAGILAFEFSPRVARAATQSR